MERITGGSLPATIWKSFLTAAQPYESGLPTPAPAPAPSGAATVAFAPSDVGTALACDIAMCSATYQSFRASDCTFQPYVGPRQVCTRGNPVAATPLPTTGQLPPTVAALPVPTGVVPTAQPAFVPPTPTLAPQLAPPGASPPAATTAPPVPPISQPLAPALAQPAAPPPAQAALPPAQPTVPAPAPSQAAVTPPAAAAVPAGPVPPAAVRADRCRPPACRWRRCRHRPPSRHHRGRLQSRPRADRATLPAARRHIRPSARRTALTSPSAAVHAKSAPVPTASRRLAVRRRSPGQCPPARLRHREAFGRPPASPRRRGRWGRRRCRRPSSTG